MQNLHLYPKQSEITDALQSLDSAEAVETREGILEDASWLKSLKAPAVTSKPSDYPRPTADLRDYISIGTYWWPNPDTPDGLPYVHRDGEFSPALENYDRLSWDLHCDGIAIFALADRLGVDCTQDAARWLETWYLDPATCMRPHLRHAQFCPGLNTGRLVGCIDFTVRIPRYIEALRSLMTYSPQIFSESDISGVAGWWNEMLDWLVSPENRAWHTEAGNNIGVYYDRSVVYLALWLGRERIADEILDTVLANRIDRQIEPDGRMPHELKRTRSFEYILMNTLGFIDLATLSELRERNLFTAISANGNSIVSAVDWIWKQATDSDAWRFPQIGPVEWSRLVRLWWCLPPQYRDQYPLASLASRIDRALCVEPRLDLLSFRLHPFHLPIWEEFPNVFYRIAKEM